METLLGWKALRFASPDEIQEEIDTLRAEGLTEQSSHMAETGEPSFRSTERGWAAREDWLRARGLRHPALAGEYDDRVEDIALACLAAAAIRSERTPPGYWASDGAIPEPVLAFYLGRCGAGDAAAIVARLQSRRYARYTTEQRIRITSSGRRHYDEVVAPALKILSPTTVLDFLAIGTVALSATPLPPDLGRNLWNRWTEARLCCSSGAYLAATIMYASVAEGVLGWWVRTRRVEAQAATSAPKRKLVEEWTLHEMLQVAKELGWLDATLAGFVNQLRDVRNLVHPWRQLQDATLVDGRVCAVAQMVAEGAVQAVAKVEVPE